MSHMSRIPTHHIHRRRYDRGLTLIEILIVIAILVAIGALVVVNVMPARDRADIDRAEIQINNIAQALDMFRLDMRRYPTEDEGIEVLWNSDVVEDDQDMDNWGRSTGNQPYIDPITEDPWGNEWIYRYPSERRGEGYFDLISMGPDGEEGTDDDITNHDRLGDEENGFDTFDDFGT